MPLKRWAALLALLLLPGLAPAREMRFITVDAAPWASQPEAPMGAFPELVREIERRTGHSIAISLNPFARVERELETGEQDCTILMWIDARARVVERGENVYVMPFGVVARKGVRLTDYDDLSALTISVVRGVPISARFDADALVRKDFDKDYAVAVRKMVHGRVEAVAGALPTIAYLAAQNGFGDALGERLVLSTVPLALQCSRRSANLDVMPQLNAAIRAMAADGTLAHVLANNHYPQGAALP